MLFMVAFLGYFMRQAAGRLAPKVAIAPIVFLITRWPVLVGWLVGSAAMFFMITASATANGKDPSDAWPMLVGLSLFSGLGFAALAIGPIWALLRVFASSPELPLDDEETVLFELPANHFLGGEARGGKLIATNQRLAFRPHRFNVQLDTWSTPLEDLGTMRVEGSRFLLLTCRGDSAGREQWIVVRDPQQVRERLQSLAAP